MGSNWGREFWVQLTHHSAISRYLIRHCTWENTQSPVRTRVTHRRTLSLGKVTTTSLGRGKCPLCSSYNGRDSFRKGSTQALGISYHLKPSWFFLPPRVPVLGWNSTILTVLWYTGSCDFVCLKWRLSPTDFTEGGNGQPSSCISRELGQESCVQNK